MQQYSKQKFSFSYFILYNNYLSILLKIFNDFKRIFTYLIYFKYVFIIIFQSL